jgi:hypothetical protein
MNKQQNNDINNDRIFDKIITRRDIVKNLNYIHNFNYDHYDQVINSKNLIVNEVQNRSSHKDEVEGTFAYSTKVPAFSSHTLHDSSQVTNVAKSVNDFYTKTYETGIKHKNYEHIENYSDDPTRNVLNSRF